MIPKILHYCWFGGGKKPDYFYDAYESWKKYLPDYEIIEWNETNYEISKYLYTDFMYKHGEFSFVSDVVRFDVLNTYEGIYLDINVILRDNLDALLNNKAFCCIDSQNPEHFASAIIGNESNSTFVNHCLKIFENILCEGMTLHHQIDNWVEVMKYVLLNEGVKLTNELQILDLCTVYPYPYFTVTAKHLIQY